MKTESKFFLIVFSFLLITSCKQDDVDLIGTWRHDSRVLVDCDDPSQNTENQLIVAKRPCLASSLLCHYEEYTFRNDGTLTRLTQNSLFGSLSTNEFEGTYELLDGSIEICLDKVNLGIECTNYGYSAGNRSFELSERRVGSGCLQRVVYVPL